MPHIGSGGQALSLIHIWDTAPFCWICAASANRMPRRLSLIHIYPAAFAAGCLFYSLFQFIQYTAALLCHQLFPQLVVEGCVGGIDAVVTEHIACVRDPNRFPFVQGLNDNLPAARIYKAVSYTHLDKDPARFGGKGVLKAVGYIDTRIREADVYKRQPSILP